MACCRTFTRDRARPWKFNVPRGRGGRPRPPLKSASAGGATVQLPGVYGHQRKSGVKFRLFTSPVGLSCGTISGAVMWARSMSVNTFTRIYSDTVSDETPYADVLYNVAFYCGAASNAGAVYPWESCPSVRPARRLWRNERTFCQDFLIPY